MGAGAKSPSALVPFAHNWVGGDIHGLSAYAGTLYGYVPEIDDVATALDGKVRQTVGDAGWQGTAAAAFTKAWDRDAAGATAVAAVTSSTGDVVDWLAVNLAKVENALEQAADETSAHGVPIGADGQPPQACLANPTAESWRAAYQGFWNECMLDATKARNTAAAALQRTGDAITGSGLQKGDMAAIADVLLGFLGAQTRYRAYVEGKIPGLKQSLKDARLQAIEEGRQADGRFGKWTQEDRGKFDGAKSRLSSVEDDLAEAQGNENLFTKVLGYSPSDVPALGSSLDDMGGFAGKMARFGADIPIVDVAAAGAGTYFSAQEDMALGVPAYAAYPGEAAGSLAALGIGGEVGGLASGGVAAGLGMLGAGGLGVSIAAGGVGVLVGGVVAYGVGDFAHNLIDENWGADMHKYGFLGGLGDGIGDSAVKTGEDFAHMGKSIWHGITSIF